MLLNKTLPRAINLGRRYDINQLSDFRKAPCSPSNANKTLLFVPVAIQNNDSKDPCVISVYFTKGAAYIARRNVKHPLAQLGNSFINGGQIIAMTLILSIISGVFIWVLVSLTVCLHFYIGSRW